MQFLYLLEKIRNPVCDFFFSAITYFGDELVFLTVAILFFWCVDKRRGYYILTVGLVGTVLNQALKLIFRIDRPWVKDPSFKPIENSIEAASGYSFPSGHTQNVTGTFGSIAASSKGRGAKIFSIVMIALVAFSRMYLGVHTPLDVGVSLILGTLLVLAFYPVFKSEESFKRYMPYVVIGCTVLSVAFVIFVILMPKEGLDPHNLESGMKNAGTLLGCTAGLVAVYFVDAKFTNFRTDAPWYFQIVKLVVGLAVVLGIKSGLSAPLTALFGNEYVARTVRYFLIVIFAGIVWPLSFNWFATRRIARLDAFGEKIKSKITGKKSEKL